MTASPQLEELLSNGAEALEQIDALGQIPQGLAIVCYHFFSDEDSENDRWGDDAHSVIKARPLFEALPFNIELDGVGGDVGIEAWERILPDSEWLEDRLPRMLEIARRAEMTFLGWSFEPKGYPIVSSGSGLNVVNANTPEGEAAVEAMIKDVQQASKATKH